MYTQILVSLLGWILPKQKNKKKQNKRLAQRLSDIRRADNILASAFQANSQPIVYPLTSTQEITSNPAVKSVFIHFFFSLKFKYHLIILLFFFFQIKIMKLRICLKPFPQQKMYSLIFLSLKAFEPLTSSHNIKCIQQSRHSLAYSRIHHPFKIT